MTARSLGLQTLALDLPPLVGAFGRRLHDARRAGQRRARGAVRRGAGPDAAGGPPPAVLDRPRGVRLRPHPGPGLRRGVRRGVRWHHRAPGGRSRRCGARSPAPPDQRPTPSARARAARHRRDAVGRRRRRRRTAARTPASPSASCRCRRSPRDEEVIRGKRFDALEPDELAALYGLMTRAVAGHAAAAHAPRRARAPRRPDRPAPHAAREPAHRRRPGPPGAAAAGGWSAGGSCCCATSRARWSPTRAPTCSSSPAPPGAGRGRNEAFVFATRLTRLTRALRSRQSRSGRSHRRQPTAPDWSSGTRIGEALRRSTTATDGAGWPAARWW